MVRSARSGRATIRGVSDFFEKIKAGAAAGSPSPRGAINTRAIPGAFRWPSQTGARGRQHRVSAGSLLNSASSPTHQLASAATDNIKVSLEARHIASEMMEGGKKKKKNVSQSLYGLPTPPPLLNIRRTHAAGSADPRRRDASHKAATEPSPSPCDPVRFAEQKCAGFLPVEEPLFAFLSRDSHSKTGL